MSGVQCEVLCVTCKVSHVKCDLSGVTYQVSCVTCYMSEKVTAKSIIVPKSSVMCHLFDVRCQMTGAMRHVLGVTCHLSRQVSEVRCPLSNVNCQKGLGQSHLVPSI